MQHPDHSARPVSTTVNGQAISEPLPSPHAQATLDGELPATPRRIREDNMDNEGLMTLLDGQAKHMGQGVFIVFQEDEGHVQSVVLTPSDLRKMLHIEEESAPAI